MNKEEFQAVKEAINTTIAHVVKRGSDDVFRPPLFSSSIEHHIISLDVERFTDQAYAETLKFIQNADLQKQRIGQIFKSLVAKDDKSFRQVTWIDPFDVVKYLSLSYLIFEKIENRRINKDENIIHSHRKSGIAGEIFDSNFGYNSFRVRSGELSREYQGKWKVVTDISNFFDRIGNHSLENHLLDIGCEVKYVTLLREILLFWSGDRRSYGIPVGSDASRIIAEAVLIDIDRRLKECGVNFVRYVDDFRFFAETRADAYSCIQLLTTLLSEEGLTLNAKKTDVHQVLDENDFHLPANRFAAEEHKVIDVEEKIEIKTHVRVSGRTHISRYYRQPGKDAVDKIKALKKDDVLNRFESASDHELEDQLRLLIKYFIYAEQDVNLIKSAIDRKITTIFYICDALIKEAAIFSDEKRSEIVEVINSSLDWHRAPYPYQVPILRLYAANGFASGDFMKSILDGHGAFDNRLFLREVISLSSGLFDRETVRRLALDVFPASPACVQRAICFAVANHPTLSVEEKRPIVKNLKQHSPDWFINNIEIVNA